MATIVTGAEGQDGLLLIQLLLEHTTGFKIVAVVRPKGSQGLRAELAAQVVLGRGRVVIETVDINDPAAVYRLVETHRPKELYHLAAQSFVGTSYDNPGHTFSVNAVGTLNVLEAVRQGCPETKVYVAATSEMFSGAPETAPQHELTPLDPQSPYGVAKVAAYQLARIYRQAYQLRVWCGILFNHESHLRGSQFVTQKIAQAAARIYKQQRHQWLLLGNLDACRDWGYAPEYVRGMVQMLQTETPDDYVLATGVTTSVRDFAKLAFAAVDLDWTKYVQVDAALVRPTEVRVLRGNAEKARQQLGWTPETDVAQLAQIMVSAALATV